MSPVSSALIFSNLLYCTCIFTTSLYSALLLRLQLSPSNYVFLIPSIPSGFQQTPFLKPLSFGLQLQRFCFCLIQLRDLTPLPPPHKKANKTNSLPHPLSPRTRSSGADLVKQTGPISSPHGSISGKWMCCPLDRGSAKPWQAPYLFARHKLLAWCQMCMQESWMPVNTYSPVCFMHCELILYTLRAGLCLKT